MTSCAVCRKNKAQYACSHSCHTLYCSPACAEFDWSKQQHYLACGDFLDDLPKPALVQVLSNFSFEEISKGSSLYKRFADIINTYSFCKAFALKHKDRTEWNERVGYWFAKAKSNLLQSWLPVLLELSIWSPDNDAFIQACWNQDVQVVLLLLATGLVDPAAQDNLPVQIAAQQDDIELMMVLLGTGLVDPSAEDNNALIIAVRNGNLKMVKLLLDTGLVDPAAQDDDPLRYALRDDHLEIAKLLLATGRAHATLNDNFYFYDAIQLNKLQMLQLLLESGQIDSDDYAMDLAQGKPEIIKLLLQYKK